MTFVLHSDTPTARKEHRCDHCGRIIEKGERYLRQDNVYDDQRFTWKSCDQCRVVFNFLWDYADADGEYGMELSVELSEYRTDSLTIGRMWVYYRRAWRRRDGTLVDARKLLPESSDSGARAG